MDNHTPGKPDMDALLAVIRELVGEVHPHWKNLHFLPDTQLERELGLDSMARVELHHRIERSLQLSLPEYAAVHAMTANDLMRAILHPEAIDSASDAADGNAAELLMGEFGSGTDSSGAGRRTPLDWLYAGYAWTIFVLLSLIATSLIGLAVDKLFLGPPESAEANAVDISINEDATSAAPPGRRARR